MGRLYRLGGRAIDYVTQIGCEFEHRDFGVIKFAKVINASQTLNLALGQRVMQGWSPQLFPWKRDLDNFFNRVTRSQVTQAWKWALFVFARAKPRRPYLNFPINKFLRREKSRCTTAHTRSFHENLRLQFLPDNHTLGQTGPFHAKDRWVIKLEDVWDLINLDFETGILMFGNLPFLPKTGCTQGSRLSPALCTMVCRWIESTYVEPARPLLSPYIKFDIWFRRWMDDIFGVIFVCVAPRASAEVREDIKKNADTYLANQLASYERQFVMKVEDPSVFVGMKVFAENAFLWFMPDPTIRLTPTGIAVRRFKFQNWCSSAEVVMKIRLIVSQICQATDRTSTELLLIRAIANLVLEFRTVSFP